MKVMFIPVYKGTSDFPCHMWQVSCKLKKKKNIKQTNKQTKTKQKTPNTQKTPKSLQTTHATKKIRYWNMNFSEIFFFLLNNLFSKKIWSFFLRCMNLSFVMQTPRSSSPLSWASFAPWAQRGRVTAALKESAVAGLVCPCSGLIPPAAQLFCLAGFLYLISWRFACSMLHFCQTAQATPPLYNCAWHLI